MRQLVYLIVGGPSPEPAVPFRVTSNTDTLGETSLIDALDLAVDRRITGAALLQQIPIRRSERFRSSSELRIRSPVYGSVKKVPPVSVEFPEYSAARSAVGPRRRSAWKRSKRFVWKSLVNVARRVCFCQAFVDLE